MSEIKFKQDWHYADADDEAMGIETAIYENGHKVKRCKLSDGRQAQVRVLKGADARTIRNLTGGDEEKYSSAVIALSTNIDGQKLIIEEVEELLLPDYSLILAMNTINFPSTQNK